MKLIKNNNFFKYIFFNILLRISSENLCDKTQYCSDCSVCGKDNNNYCSCNFNNAFCKDEKDGYNFLPDFLFDYDQCQNKNNQFIDICGASDVNLELGKNTTITFPSTKVNEILCYYNIKKINNNNNNLHINIKKESEKYSDISIYFVYYLNTEIINIQTIADIRGKKDFNYNINESYVEKVSLYVSVKEAENINDISIDFYVDLKSITKISHKINSNKLIKIVMIIIISVFGVLLIILIILLIRRYKCKKCINTPTNNKNNNKENKSAIPIKYLLTIFQHSALINLIFIFINSNNVK